MMLFYEEIRGKIKNQSKSNLKNNIYQNNNEKKSIPFNNYKIEKEPNSKYIIDNKNKSNSFFMTKKKKELQKITNIKKDNKIIAKKNPYKKKNKQFLYTFQNFYNNYPIPEPLPKKIDIRIINDNNNSNISNLNESKRNEKSLYDDKTILFILTNLGLEDLFLKFKDNRITYNDLQFLTKEDFIEMKIPIGPRNRIIHFIQEMKRNKLPLDFESLKNFIDKYKKTISIQNINFGNNYICNDKIKIENKNDNFIYDKKSQNSLIFSSQFDLEKNENLSPLEKNINSFLSFNNYFNNNIYSNKSNNNNLEDFPKFNQDKDKNKNKLDNEINHQKYLSEKHLENVNSSKSLNYGKIKKEENILNQISYNKNSRNKNSDNLLLEQKEKENEKVFNYNNKRSYSQNIIKNNVKRYKPQSKSNNLKIKSNYTYNYEYIKVRHLNKNYSNNNYNEYIPTKKKIKANTKEKNKRNVLKRNSTYTNIKNYEKVKNPYESFYSNNSNLSRNLLNKLDLINKEVEKYESNYERLKNETKIRNKNVNLILSNNNIIIKNNNNNHKKSRNVVYVHNKDLENEKERSLKNELNSRNFRI